MPSPAPIPGLLCRHHLPVGKSALERHMARMLSRRLLITALLPLALDMPMSPHPAKAQAQAAARTPANQADIARIQAYLNSLRTLKAHFVQVAPNGAISQGTAWLDRPGRMRFQYDPPSPLLLVAGHGLVVFHDSALDQTSNIPIGLTPLGILLADNISLGGDVTVTGLNRLPGETELTLVRTAHPTEGSLALVFADNPLTLRQWTVTDAQAQRTTVTLNDIELGGKFDQHLFEYINPNFFQRNGGNG
jgi:outer membrane lipoprotein-sorting protein